MPENQESRAHEFIQGLAVPPEMKQRIWQDFFDASDEADFDRRFGPIELPEGTKGALRRLKLGGDKTTELLPPSPEEARGALGFLSNVPGSAYRLIEPFLHPVESAKGLGKLGAGVVETMAGTDFGHRQYPAAVIEALKQRYGGWEELKRTAYEDPLGFAADASALLSIAGGSLRAGATPARAAGALRPVPGLQAAARAFRTASEFTNPLTLPAMGLEAAAKAGGRVSSEVLGLTTGAGGEAIRTIWRNPAAAKPGIRHVISDIDLVNDFKEALGTIKSGRAVEYQNRLAEISRNSASLDLAPIRTQLLDELKRFNVKVGPGGFDFSRVPIANPSERTLFENIVGDVVNWGTQPGDLTPVGVDALKRRIGDWYTPSGEARAFAQRMKVAVRDVLERQVPGYREMTSGYSKASDLIDNIESELSLGRQAQPGTAVRKLSYALKQNNEYRQLLVEALEQYTKKDLKAELAGWSMREIHPRGLMGPLSGLGVMGMIMSGGLAPAHLLELLAVSPRAVSESILALSTMKRAAAGAASVAIDPAVYRTLNLGTMTEIPEIPSPWKAQ